MLFLKYALCILLLQGLVGCVDPISDQQLTEIAKTCVATNSTLYVLNLPSRSEGKCVPKYQLITPSNTTNVQINNP